jgi:hypothetical protein
VRQTLPDTLWLAEVAGGEFVDAGSPPDNTMDDGQGTPAFGPGGIPIGPRAASSSAVLPSEPASMQDAPVVQGGGVKQPPVGTPVAFDHDVPRPLAVLAEGWRQGALADVTLSERRGNTSASNRLRGDARASLRRGLKQPCHPDHIRHRQTQIDPDGQIFNELNSTLDWEFNRPDDLIKLKGWANQPLSTPTPATKRARVGAKGRGVKSSASMTPLPTYTPFSTRGKFAETNNPAPPTSAAGVAKGGESNGAGPGEPKATGPVPAAQAKRWAGKAPPAAGSFAAKPSEPAPAPPPAAGSSAAKPSELAPAPPHVDAERDAVTLGGAGATAHPLATALRQRRS